MSQYKEPTLVEALETIARQAVQITRLEHDNDILRAELDLLHEERPSSTSNDVNTRCVDRAENATDAMRPSTTAAPPNGLVHQYAELQARFADLRSEHDKCRPKIREAITKYRAAKERCRQWRDYLEKDERYSKFLGPDNPVMPAPTPESNNRNPNSHFKGDMVEKTKQPMSIADSTTPVTSMYSRTAAPVRSTVASNPSQSSARSPASIRRVVSSQATVVEPTPEPGPQLETEPCGDDSPVVVSARSLKRKAGATTGPELSSRRVKQEPTSPVQTIELSSDDVVGVASQSDDDGECDLDGNPLQSPPRNRLQFDLNQPPRHGSIEPDGSSPMLTRNAILRSGGKSVAPLPASSTRNFDHKFSSHSRQTTPIASRPTPENQIPPRALENVLQPLSANVRIQKRRTQWHQGSKSVIEKGRRDVSGVMLLSESGKDPASQINQKTPHTREGRDGLSSDIKCNQKLEDLVDALKHERTPNLTRKAVNHIAMARTRRSSSHSAMPASEMIQTSPVTRNSLAKKPGATRLHETPPPIRPEEEPLRNLDPRTLNLEDFKVNPSYMGTEFAFADTLRGRDARRNLQTCTRADCCGSTLEKAVAFGGPSVSGKTDAEALESYLGPDWETHISAYGQDERKDIVMQAHVHIFANKHGKHRQAFARRSTPPGFWDTDFPTMQEAVQHREKALDMVRHEVRERWREALREGGRWKFRDE